MNANDMEIVSSLRAALKQRIGDHRYELWFGSNTRLSAADKTLLVEVPNAFMQDWLRTNFRKSLEASGKSTLGHVVDIEFRIDPSLETEKDAAEPDSEGDLAQTKSNSTESTPATIPLRPGARKTAAEMRYHQMDDFVVGTSNRVAHSAAAMATEDMGSISPLYFYGPTGVGKTHLMEGILDQVSRQGRALTVYMSAEDFTCNFLEALRHSGLPSFRRKYRRVDLLVLDDIQFFAGKRATLNEVLHTVDAVLKRQGQIVLAADAPPQDLAGLGPELTARLSSGMVCRMDSADMATRRQILQQLAEKREVQLSSDVCDLIAAQFTQHARELSGALNRLIATSRATGEAITRDMADAALADLVTSKQGRVGLAEIEQIVCDEFGLETESLRSAKKARAYSRPRMLAMWLARKHTGQALTEIGTYFGRRSHTTVLSAEKRVNVWMASGEPLDVIGRSTRTEDAVRRIEAKLHAG